LLGLCVLGKSCGFSSGSFYFANLILANAACWLVAKKVYQTFFYRSALLRFASRQNEGDKRK
jgi:hypothetical protein